MRLFQAETRWATFQQGATVSIYARFEALATDGQGNRVPLVTADVDTVSVTPVIGTLSADGVFTPSDDQGGLAVDTPEPGDVWRDTLGQWPEDFRGYNFSWQLAADALSEFDVDGKHLLIEVVVTLTSGTTAIQQWCGPIKRSWS